MQKALRPFRESCGFVKSKVFFPACRGLAATAEEGRRRGWLAVLAGAVAMWSAGTAEALPITTAVGNGADASVMLTGAVDTNFGSDPLLYVTRQITVDPQFTYLRFDISGVSDPIVAVQVDLARTAVGYGTVNFFGLNDDAAGNDWDEASITWNTAPAKSGGGLDSTLITPLGGFGGFSSPGTETFSTAALLSFVNADSDGLITLILGSTLQLQPGGVFASKENTGYFAPTLNLTLANTDLVSVDEPASFAVFGLGLMGIGALRRRHRKSG